MDERALNVLNMNKDYGGRVPIFNSSQILRREGFLGKYTYPDHDYSQLKPGDAQYFPFNDNDDGPFYLTPTEREERKYDATIGIGKKRKKRRQEQC